MGLDLDEVLVSLRGKPGVPVTITVRRGNKEIEFHTTRAMIEVHSPQRQAELINALKFFADSLGRLRQMSKNNLDRLNILAENVAHGQQDPVFALQSVPKDLANQIIQIKRETNAVIKKGRELFREQKVALEESEFIFSHIQEIENIAKIDLLREAGEREKRMKQLIESDERLSSIEKNLFRAYCIDVMLIRSSLQLLLEIEKNSINRMDIQRIFDESRKRSQENTFFFANNLEMWRSRLVEDIKRIEALDKGQPFFEKAVNFLISFGHEKEALVISEKAKARAFADLLESKYSQEALWNEINRLNLDGRQDRSEEYSQEALEKIGALALSNASAPPVTKENILEIVKQNGSTVVEYFLMDEQIVIWVISPSGEIETRIVSIDKAKLEESIDKVTQFVSSQELSKRDRTDFSVLLHNLYQDLVQPVEDLLPASADEVITLIPHDSLFLVPFGALVTRLTDDSGKRPKYFIEAHPLVYSPSIAVLRCTLKNKEQGVHKGVPNFLALVNPTVDHLSTEQNFNSLNTFYRDSQQNTIFRRKEATREALEQALEIGSPYTTLYFGTHGRAFDDKPSKSYLSLSGSRLMVSDVIRLNLHTDLVILAACETARGKITGDGVNGLSRAFTYAGAPSLLISLWSVPEEQTFYQILLFHHYWIEKGHSKAQALREAQVEALNDYPYQPNVWAGFILFGEWQ